MKLSTKSLAVAAGVAATVAGLVTVGAAPAFAAGGYHYLALRAPVGGPKGIESIYVAGTGFTTWNANYGQIGGSVGFAGGPVSLESCYQYVGGNVGGWVTNVGGASPSFQIFTFEGEGGLGVGNEYQHSNPEWEDGTSITIETFSSNNCGDGLVATKRTTVTTDGLTYDWVDFG